MSKILTRSMKPYAWEILNFRKFPSVLKNRCYHPKNGKPISVNEISFSDGNTFKWYKYLDIPSNGNIVNSPTVGFSFGGPRVSQENWIFDTNNELSFEKNEPVNRNAATGGTADTKFINTHLEHPKINSLDGIGVRVRQRRNVDQSPKYNSFDEELKDLCKLISHDVLKILHIGYMDSITDCNLENIKDKITIEKFSYLQPHPLRSDRYKDARSQFDKMANSNVTNTVKGISGSVDQVYNQGTAKVDFDAAYELRITFTNPSEPTERAVVYRNSGGVLNITMKKPFLDKIKQELSHREFIHELINNLDDLWKERDSIIPKYDVIITFLYSDVVLDY